MKSSVSRKKTNEFSLKTGIIVSEERSMKFEGSTSSFALSGSIGLPNLSFSTALGGTRLVLLLQTMVSEQNASSPDRIYMVIEHMSLPMASKAFRFLILLRNMMHDSKLI